MVIKQKCLECNKFFDINDAEQNWYKTKGFVLPKRCKSCRAIKRKQNINKEGNYGQKKR